MIIVRQYNNFACVTACLESFLRDCGQKFDHKNFIQDNLDLFNKGLWCEGACSTENFQELANRLKLNLEVLNSFDIETLNANETVLFMVNYNGNEGEKHCVRFHSSSGPGIINVMNPMKSELDYIFVNWVFGIYKFNTP